MATKTLTSRDTTPAIAIEKLDSGQYQLRVRVQSETGEDTVVLSHAEILTIGTAGERTAVLAWLVKAYNAGLVKAGFTG